MAHRKWLVLSALGPDKTGLVAAIAEHVTSRGGNVEDSRMAILGHEFGVMMLVSGDEAAVDAITIDLHALEQKTGLGLLARPTSAPDEKRHQGGLPCRIEASALDREGIVQALAASLQQLGISVVSLETTAYHASMSGAPLFRLLAHVEVPRSVGLSTLRERMAEAARALDLDIDVSPAG
jgi:glycine cleavage system transcriptional repressor